MHILFHRPSAQLSRTNSQTSSSSSLPSTAGNSSLGSSKESYCGKCFPKRLDLDSILTGKTCPPITLKDFNNYLVHEEKSPENLQFWVWYQDYKKRFDALPASQKCLSPAPSSEKAGIFQTQRVPKLASKKITPKASIDTGSTYTNTTFTTSTDNYAPAVPEKEGFKENVKETEKDIDLSLGITNEQPFRDEVAKVISTFLQSGGPKALNLSHNLRQETFAILQNTTHPDAFSAVAQTCYDSLVLYSHPNFLRFAMTNGNGSRILFAKFLGILFTALGLALGIAAICTGLPRGYRAFGALLIIPGIATEYCAWMGMCIVLHSLHHVQLRPWELFDAENDDMFEQKYKKRFLLRRIMDKEHRVQDPAIRQLQNSIGIRAIIWGLICGVIYLAIFMPVPNL